MTREEERAVEALEALGRSVRSSVERARRVRSRLTDVGIRVLDEVVSQLARRPVQTRPRDLFRRAQQLTERVLDAFPGGVEAAPSEPGSPIAEPAPSGAAAPRRARAPEAAASAGAPSRPTPEVPAAGAATSAPADAAKPNGGGRSQTAASPAVEPVQFVGVAPSRPPRPAAAEAPRPAVSSGRPGAALIADASRDAPEDHGGLQLLVRDPAWGYVSWRVSLEQITAAAAGMSRAEARLEIREVGAPTPVLDEPVAPARGRYFFRWPRPGRRYEATLYVGVLGGPRATLARALAVDVPEPVAAPSSSASPPAFGVPEVAAGRAEEAAGASAGPRPDLDLAAVPAGAPSRHGGTVGASQLSASSWSGGASQLAPTSWSGGASQLAPTSWSGGASQLAPTSWSGGASQLAPTSWSGGASQLAPTSWSGGASQLAPTSWSGGASQLAPTSWSGGASQLAPTSWSGGASQLVPTSWSGGASQLAPTSWSGGASQLAPTSWRGGASQLTVTSWSGGASQLAPTSWRGGASQLGPSSWASGRPGFAPATWLGLTSTTAPSWSSMQRSAPSATAEPPLAPDAAPAEPAPASAAAPSPEDDVLFVGLRRLAPRPESQLVSIAEAARIGLMDSE